MTMFMEEIVAVIGLISLALTRTYFRESFA